MLPKKPNSNSQKVEKKQLEEKVSKFVQENDGLSTTDIINKASQIKKPPENKSMSQSKKSTIPKPPEQQIKQIKSETNPQKQQIKKEDSGIINNISQTESLKSNQMNEKQQSLKLKEKQREIQLLNDKIKTQEGEIQNLKNQVEKYADLLNEKVKQTTLQYNERRFLILNKALISKQQQIFRMTQVVQLTRQIQYELENQLLSLKGQMESITDEFDGAYRIITFCEKQCERMKYIQSQQLHEQETKIEQSKNTQNQILEQLIKVDSCIAGVINIFDANRLQYNFIDDQLITQLDALSMNLNRFIQISELPKIKLKPSLVLIQEEFQRVSGSFNKIFPHYNSVNELIKKQIQNDKVYVQLDHITQESKQLLDYPLAIRSINILRSLVIHCLLSIHTFNTRPTFKSFFEIIQPFLKDCLDIFEQYNQNNEQMGQSVIWELFKSQRVTLINQMEIINKEMIQIKQEYQGYWNHKIFETQQQ